MHPKVTVITNIIAPYRLATFAELAQAVELSVLFCDQGGGAGLDWRLSVDDYPFDAEILGGVSWHGRQHASLDNAAPVYYLSPNVLRALRRRNPDVIITGGYSMPSLYASLYCRLKQKRLILFSDGTPRSERHISAAQQLARAWLIRGSDAALAGAVRLSNASKLSA